MAFLSRRHALPLSAFVVFAGASLSVAFAGCASTTVGNVVPVADAAPDAPDAPFDAGIDADDASEEASLLGVRCPTNVCATGETCCAVDGTNGPHLQCATGKCPSGGFAIDCDGPEDCTDTSRTLCCGSLNVDDGQPPACPLISVTTSCSPACATDVAQACPGTSTVRLCHVAADCTESGFTNCCAFKQGAVTATFCVDDTMAGYSASCL